MISHSSPGDSPTIARTPYPVLTESDRGSLRNVALLRQRSSQRTMEECLDEVASESGFRSWQEIERACSYTAKLEALIRNGFCMLVERRHASYVDTTQFEPMPLLWEMRKRDVIAWWRSEEDREALRKVVAGVHRHSRREIFTIVPRDYLGLRYIGTEPLPSHGQEVLPWLQRHGFLAPDLAWLYGECVTTEVIFFLQENS